MFIYKITNIKNEKMYIGQTIRPIEKRFARHINDAMNNILDTHFARAIRKYGAESFIIECIDTAVTQEELTEKEHYWINCYKSNYSNIGYNETNAMTKCGGNTYVSKTSAEMEIISAKLRDSKTGDKNPHATQIKCKNIFTNEELLFETAEACRKYFGEATHRFITGRVCGQTRSLYNGCWAIAYVKKDYAYDTVIHKKGKRVLIENIDNGKIKEYASIRLASRELNLARHKITESLKINNSAILGKYKITVID